MPRRSGTGTVRKILDQEEVKPHKVRYYLEQRDPDFAEKMAEVLCVYRQVKIIKQAAAVSKAKKRPSDAVAIISYDEKPGIQAIATTAPDLPPEPGVHATFAREHEYKRYGTVSLLAGIDLVTGKVHALAKDRHRSREFIEFLELLDAAYPTQTAIKLILDNHSAHISKETRAWLAAQPAHRFEFTFTPKHGSWLNLVEGFFSKLARSVLRHIRVTSKQSSRIASWPPWIISTAIPSFTPGPTSSTRPHDMIFELRNRPSSGSLAPSCAIAAAAWPMAVRAQQGGLRSADRRAGGRAGSDPVLGCLTTGGALRSWAGRKVATCRSSFALARMTSTACVPKRGAGEPGSRRHR